MQAQVQKSLYKTPIVDQRNTLWYSDRALYAPKQTRARFLDTVKFESTGNNIPTASSQLLDDNVIIQNITGNLNRVMWATWMRVPEQGTYIFTWYAIIYPPGWWYLWVTYTLRMDAQSVWSTTNLIFANIVHTIDIWSLPTRIPFSATVNLEKWDILEFRWVNDYTGTLEFDMFYQVTKLS